MDLDPDESHIMKLTRAESELNRIKNICDESDQTDTDRLVEILLTRLAWMFGIQI